MQKKEAIQLRIPMYRELRVASQRQKKLPTSEKVFLSLENYPLGEMIITILFKK